MSTTEYNIFPWDSLFSSDKQQYQLGLKMAESFSPSILKNAVKALSNKNSPTKKKSLEILKSVMDDNRNYNNNLLSFKKEVISKFNSFSSDVTKSSTKSSAESSTKSSTESSTESNSIINKNQLEDEAIRASIAAFNELLNNKRGELTLLSLKKALGPTILSKEQLTSILDTTVKHFRAATLRKRKEEKEEWVNKQIQELSSGLSSYSKKSDDSNQDNNNQDNNNQDNNNQDNKIVDIDSRRLTFTLTNIKK